MAGAALLAVLGMLLCLPASATVPGIPGTTQAGTTIYIENFENGSGVTELEAYASSSGVAYTADPYWLLQQRCNGFILNYGNAYPGAAYCNTINTQWNYLRAMTNALGLPSGTTTTNRALSTLSTGGCNATTGFCSDSAITPNQIEFGTNGQLTLSTTNRFVTFSVDAAATFCNFAHPALRFYLRNNVGVEIPVSTSAIDPCTDSRAQTATIDGVSIRYGSFAANGSTLVTGNSLGIVLRNETNDSLGNDSAIDNIRVIDVSPQLDKSFAPTTVTIGGVSTITFTITNTSELAAKNGWSFADTLPSGLAVASPNAATTTCSSGVVTAPPGSTGIVVSGNLNAGQSSCTVRVNVTSAAPATYNNCPSTNVTNLIGLNPPACAAVTFQTATVTLRKISLGGVGAFGFTGSNGISAQTITTTVAGTAVSGSAQNLTAPGVATTITETYTAAAAGAPDFVITTFTCTGMGTGGTAVRGTTTNANQITLNAAATAAGSNIVCTITNAKAVNVLLAKTWIGATVNDSASLFTANVFARPNHSVLVTETLNSTANSSSETDTTAVGNNNKYGVGDGLFLSETLGGSNASSYQASAWSCTGGVVSGNQLTLVDADAGTVITCTITNSGQSTDLTVVKLATPSSLQTGRVVTYTITATNNGPIAANGAVLRDTAGAGLNCATPATTATCSASGGATCPGPTVPVASLLGSGITVSTFPVGGQVAVTLQCTVEATGSL